MDGSVEVPPSVLLVQPVRAKVRMNEMLVRIFMVVASDACSARGRRRLLRKWG
jgi:hypothetical protein